MFKNLTIWITCFLCSNAFAQLPADYSLKHSIKQDGLSMQFTVLDPDIKGINHHKVSKTYYWYKAQHVLYTQGGNSGQLLHGKFEALYGSKQLCRKGEFFKGLKHKEWNYWRPDGKLLKTENWKKGKQKGKQYDYDQNGDLYKITVIRWRKARSNTLDSIVEIHGTHKKITVIDSLGAKVSVARYKNSQLHGKQEVYTGEKNVSVYKKGELIPQKEKKSEKPGASSDGESKEGKKKFSEKVKSMFHRKDKEQKTDLKASENKEASRQKKKDKKAGEPKSEKETSEKRKLLKKKKE